MGDEKTLTAKEYEWDEFVKGRLISKTEKRRAKMEKLEKLIEDIRELRKKLKKRIVDDFGYCETCGCFHYANAHLHRRKK